MTSEYFLNCGDEITTSLVDLINTIFQCKEVPDILKEGVLTLVFKKGDVSNLANYSGISITPILLRIIEHILNKRHNPITKTYLFKYTENFTTKK